MKVALRKTGAVKIIKSTVATTCYSTGNQESVVDAAIAVGAIPIANVSIAACNHVDYFEAGAAAAAG